MESFIPCAQRRAAGRCNLRPAVAAPLLPLLLLLLLAGAMPGALGAPASAQEDNALPCTCSDVDPREEFIKPAPFTCWEQYKFGACNQTFIMQTIVEIPEGYCQITCGHCNCCPTLLNATLAAGLAEFAWAMNVTSSSGRFDALDQPGLMATLLAPGDSAMQDLFRRLGGKERITSDQAVRDKLGSILELHYLPPLNDTRAVWTAPFFQPGTRLPSQGSPDALVVAQEQGEGGGPKIQAPGSSAEVKRADIYACKGFIQELNWYLLPASSTDLQA